MLHYVKSEMSVADANRPIYRFTVIYQMYWKKKLHINFSVFYGQEPHLIIHHLNLYTHEI